eukprot:gene2725-2976_t
MVNLKYLALEQAYNYIFTTVPISAIRQDVARLLHQLLQSSCQTILALLTLIYYLGLLLSKLLILAFPHAIKIGEQVYKFHVTQLTAYDIFIEVTVVTLILLALIFRKKLRNAWIRFEVYVSAKSRAAARAAPHVLFFTSALLLAVVGRKFILPLTSSAVMPLFTLGIPLINTIFILKKSYVRRDDEEERPNEKQKNVMVLWVVLAIYHGLVTLLSAIPFSVQLLNLLPYLKEAVIVILIWIQLSPVFTDLVFSSLITSILCRLARYIPTAQTFENQIPAPSTLTMLLKMIRIFSDHQIELMVAVLQDSAVSLISLGFLFTPGPIAQIGMVLVAFILPAFRVVALTDNLVMRLTPRGHNSATAEGDQRLVQAYKHWMHYFLCVDILWLIRIYVFPPWPSVVILLTLWLQHAYFRGGLRTVEWTLNTFCLLRERHQRIRAERLSNSSSHLMDASGSQDEAIQSTGEAEYLLSVAHDDIRWPVDDVDEPLSEPHDAGRAEEDYVTVTTEGDEVSFPLISAVEASEVSAGIEEQMQSPSVARRSGRRRATPH